MQLWSLVLGWFRIISLTVIVIFYLILILSIQNLSNITTYLFTTTFILFIYFVKDIKKRNMLVLISYLSQIYIKLKIDIKKIITQLLYFLTFIYSCSFVNLPLVHNLSVKSFDNWLGVTESIRLRERSYNDNL